MSQKKFTLIELLIVVAIIGILVSLLLPSLAKSREKTKRAVCISNQRQIGIALSSYEDTYKVLPTANANLNAGIGVGSTWWRTANRPMGVALLKLTGFLDTPKVFYCPSWSFEPFNYGNIESSGNRGGWAKNEVLGPWPKNNVMISYHYRDTLTNTPGYPAAKSADYKTSTTAISSDHWTRAVGVFWGDYTHKDAYATLYLDGHAKLVYDLRRSYMAARQTATTTNLSWSLHETIWREFFDK